MILQVMVPPMWTHPVPGHGIPGIKAHAIAKITTWEFAKVDGGVANFTTRCGMTLMSEFTLEPPADPDLTCGRCLRTSATGMGLYRRRYVSTIIGFDMRTSPWSPPSRPPGTGRWVRPAQSALPLG